MGAQILHLSSSLPRPIFNLSAHIRPIRPTAYYSTPQTSWIYAICAAVLRKRRMCIVHRNMPLMALLLQPIAAGKDEERRQRGSCSRRTIGVTVFHFSGELETLEAEGFREVSASFLSIPGSIARTWESEDHRRFIVNHQGVFRLRSL